MSAAAKVELPKLTVPEARALARAASLVRDVFGEVRHECPCPPGEAPLELAHAKVVSGLERLGVRWDS